MNNWPICAQIGVLHGMIAGFTFGIVHCCAPMSNQDLAWMIVLCAVAGLHVSTFILVVLRRYAFASVFWQTFVNAILVSLLTVLVLSAIGPHPLIVLLGLVAGFLLGALVGAMLCWLCGRRAVLALNTRG